METFMCNGHASATGSVAAEPRWAAPNAEGIRAERGRPALRSDPAGGARPPAARPCRSVIVRGSIRAAGGRVDGEARGVPIRPRICPLDTRHVR